MTQTPQEEREKLQGREPEKDAEPVADPAETVTRVVDETEQPHGESRTGSPTAPRTAGKPHGGEGVVDAEQDTDLRPKDPGGPRPDDPGGETPVPDPSVSTSRRTGSAGAASVMAGSEGPDTEPEPDPQRNEDEEMEEVEA